ncbi:hypothetical protein [Bdellovibrio sp. HCB209]|uniref:hypothetical protein n=1 Tax=Bdellovibrio sp. HCB209 TaxID=3394354 RepID=UPI0039B6E334
MVFTAAPAAEKTPDKSLVILFVTSGNELVGKNETAMIVDAFRDLGFKLEFRRVPLARGAQEISNENIDGELVRVREYGDTHPDLIRVEEPIAKVYFSIYAKRGAEVPCSWKELLGSKLRIDFQRGIHYFEMNLKDYVSTRVESIDTPMQMFQRLQSSRSDVFLLDRQSADNVIAKSPKKWNVERVCDLHVSPAYMYLKKTHAELAGKLPELFRKHRKPGAGGNAD